MNAHIQRVRSALKVVVPTFMTICLLSLAASYFFFPVSPARAALSSDKVASASLITPAPGFNHGCPVGYFCIYPQDKGWNGDRPSLKYYRYGVYQLHNQVGTHYIFNNQTSRAWVWLCTDWNGNNSAGRYSSPDYEVVNLTPINSIRLTP
ncbi:hypothetical protein KSF_075970 [Reticulibacter mediterranei]|uniref:Peptidase inhibitor family I36 n=1 Tax=Reticulibacter mediterranei TaxID=2778369 RepID=A0A8J3ITE5_9CHLR|nr:hypothetical protein [Reticulibacter mediterranei]GHO97549.1 hypothetical protein KSF_075970 [Reticulibacter mediterranei]